MQKVFPSFLRIYWKWKSAFSQKFGFSTWQVLELSSSIIHLDHRMLFRQAVVGLANIHTPNYLIVIPSDFI